MDRKLSFTTMGTPQLDHRGAIELAGEFGFDGIDLRCADYLGEVQPGSHDAQLRQVARDFEAAALSIPGLLCYHQISSLDESWLGAYCEHVAQHLSIGARLGAQTIRLWGVRPGEGVGSGELVPGSVDAIGRALAREACDVGVLMQNHLGFGRAEDAVDIARQLGDPRFGLVYSPDHRFLYELDTDDAVMAEALALTREVYIADLAREANGRRWVFPGEGEVPLRETVALLDARDFQGFYTFKWEKIWNAELPEPQVAMPRFVSFMRSV